MDCVLHYAPIVGYDEGNFFLADSLQELVNCQSNAYNRIVTDAEFEKLWNTRMLKMPFYKNTYITAERDDELNFE